MTEASKAQRVVLGIDAAWTASEPSGVALLCEADAGRWQCLAVTPSYSSFIAGQPAWSTKHRGSTPDPAALLRAGRRELPAGGAFSLSVAVDMPMATVPIAGRRVADNAVSTRYGGAHCGTHSPNPTRPGLTGVTLTQGFIGAGLRLATVGTAVGDRDEHLVEVYPHPALLALLPATDRVPYKIAKAGKRWPGTSVKYRIGQLLAQFDGILVALRREIDGITLALPSAASVTTLAELKKYEDGLDALISAWVGTRFLQGWAEPFGDATAAIWCPTMPSLSHNHGRTATAAAV